MSFDGLIVENENTKSGYNDGNVGILKSIILN